MRVLITGSSGLLGAHLAAACAPTADVIGTDRHEPWGDVPMEFLRGDLSLEGTAEAIVERARPDVLIHCAGLVDVDRCEREPALAYVANAEITRRLARAVSAGAFFVYITTDGIFQGNAPLATEETLPCPRTVYGRSKLHGEWEVQLARRDALIVRTNFFGWSSGRKLSSAEWLYGSLLRGDRITLFDDFYFTPLYVVEVARYIRALIDCRCAGIVHVAGRDRVSKYEFGTALATLCGFSANGITRGSIESAQLLAPRPKDMSLGVERLTQVLGRAPQGMLEGLRQFVADRERPLSERAGVPLVPADAPNS